MRLYAAFRHFGELRGTYNLPPPKKAQKTGIGEKPPSCAKCQYYQPDFKYRKCLYARCPYQRDTEIFRKKPLKKGKIPGSEVVKMDTSSFSSPLNIAFFYTLDPRIDVCLRSQHICSAL